MKIKEFKTSLPTLTKEKMKSKKIDKCQLRGEPLDHDPEGHHVIQKADVPRKACNPSNIVVIKKKIHNTIHGENAGSPET